MLPTLSRRTEHHRAWRCTCAFLSDHGRRTANVAGLLGGTRCPDFQSSILVFQSNMLGTNVASLNVTCQSDVNVQATS